MNAHSGVPNLLHPASVFQIPETFLNLRDTQFTPFLTQYQILGILINLITNILNYYFN